MHFGVSRRALRFTMIVSLTLLSACGTTRLPELTGGSKFADVKLVGNADDPSALGAIVAACNTSHSDAFRIDYQPFDASADERQRLTRRLSAKDNTIDIVSLHAHQIAEFADAKWIRPLGGSDKKSVVDTSFAVSTASVTYDKRVWASPISADPWVLWFRNDAVSTTPATWADVVATADALAARRKAHEVAIPTSPPAATFTAMSALLASARGTLLDAKGTHVVSNPATVDAATTWKMLVGSKAGAGIHDGITAASARQAFVSGPAVFYVAPISEYRTLHDRLGPTLGWAPWPTNAARSTSVSPTDGLSLAVSSYSKHQRQALKAIACLRSAENQRTLTRIDGVAPATPSVLDAADASASVVTADAMRTSMTHGINVAQSRVFEDLAAAVASSILPADGDAPALADRMTSRTREVLIAKGIKE